MVLGHTHQPMMLQVGGLHLVNPGSIYGVTMRDSHTCGVLTLPEVQFEVYHLSTHQQIPLKLIVRSE